MRLGNAFRKGYNEAVDTSRRRRSENAELFQSYVKMNADMGAKVSTEDLANYKSSLSGGTSYFGAGLPSSGALQETSKRLGQIQANKQTVAAGNALGNITKQLAIAKELAKAHIGTDHATEEKDADGKVKPGGTTAYASYQAQLDAAGIKGDMFTFDWFKNNNFLNQQADFQQYYRDQGLMNLQSDSQWTAAYDNAPQRHKAAIQALRESTVSRLMSDYNSTATSQGAEGFQDLIKTSTTLEAFKQVAEQRFKNSFPNGFVPDQAAVDKYMELATKEYETYRPSYIAETLNKVDANLAVDTTDPVQLEKAAKAFFARNGLGIPTDAEIDIYGTNLRAANKPKRIAQANNNLDKAKSSLTGSFAYAGELLQKYNDDAKRREYVTTLLENTTNDYDVLKALDPGIYQRHFDELLGALTIGSESAIAEEEKLDQAALLEFVSNNGTDLDRIFTQADIGGRKGKAFEVLNNHRAMLGMDPYEMTENADGEEKFPDEFEDIYKRLDSRGAYAHAKLWQTTHDRHVTALNATWDASADYWKNEQSVKDLIMGDGAVAKVARVTLSSLAATSHIPMSKRVQASQTVLKIVRDMGLDTDATPEELQTVVDIAKATLMLPSTGNKAGWVQSQAIQMQDGIPPPQTYYQTYEDGLFKQLSAIAIQKLQRDIASLPITATPEAVQKVREKITNELTAGIETFVAGLQEDEVRWSVREIPAKPKTSIDLLAEGLFQRILDTKPLVKPEWLTRTKNANGETSYAMMTADSRKIGKTFKDANGELLNAFFYYDLVDGQLVKGERMTPAAAKNMGLVVEPPPGSNDQSSSRPPGSGIHNAFAKNRNRTGNGALVEGFQRAFGGASDEVLQNNLPFQVVQARRNEARREENQTQTDAGGDNTAALQAGMTDQFIASVNGALQDSFTSVDPQDYSASKQWQRTEMPRVIGEILKSAGLPSDEQSVSIAMQILSQQ